MDQIAQEISLERQEIIPMAESFQLTKNSSTENSEDVVEQPKKIQKTSGIFGMLSNIASGISSASQTVVEQAKEVSKVVQKKIEEAPLVADFNKMQQDFILSKNACSDGQLSELPWTGAANEEQLRAEILALSKDRRNFVRDPPSAASLDFNVDSVMPVAALLLDEDPDLERMRFELVPKTLNETAFWRNYFYRVSLVKQSYLLSRDTAPPQDEEKEPSLNRDDVSVASNLDLMDGSVVGDSDAHHENVIPTPPINTEISTDAKKTSIGAAKNTDDGWEQELQQTLDSYELVDGEAGDVDLDNEAEISA